MKKSKQATQANTFLSAKFFQSLIVGLFHFLVISVPLYFTFNTSELFEFNKMVLTYTITAVVIAAWVARMIVSQKVIFKKTYLDIPILIFLISQLLSVIFSIHPYTSLLGYYSRFHGGLVSIISYTLLYYAFVSNVEKKHLSRFFLSAIGAGIIVSFYAVLEHFGHSFSCLMVDGVNNFGVDCWIQDVKNRVFATFGQPNWLAAYLIMLQPMATVLSFQNYKQKSLKWFFAGSALLFYLTLLFTQSRSGFLGAALGMTITVGILIWKKWQSTEISTFANKNKNSLLLLALGALFISAYWGTPYSPSVSTLLRPPATAPADDSIAAPVANRLDIGGTDSGEIRKIVWQGAIKVWQRYPIFGSGAETFAYSYYQDRPLAHNTVSEWDFLYNKAHNEFLNFLATTGIVGLLSYLALLGYFSWYLLRRIISSKKSDSPTVLLYSALLGGLAALSVSNFFGFSTVMVTVLMYLFFAIPAVVTNNEEEPAVRTKELSSNSYLLLSATGLFCIFFLRVIFQYWSADVAYTKGKAYLDAGYLEQGVEQLNLAIARNSQEATFYDELANQYAAYAVAYAQEGQTAQAQALLVAADEMANVVHQLNPRQLNFYKTRTRVYITLAQIKPEYLETAKQILIDARSLAPTDPKLVYNLGIVEISLNDVDGGISHLQEAVELKPDYESARLQLAIALEGKGNTTEAMEQYQYILEHINPNNTEAQQKIASLSAQLEEKK